MGGIKIPNFYASPLHDSGTPVNKIDRKTKKAAKLHGRAQRVQEKAFASRDGWEENKTSKRKDKRAKKIEEKATEIKTPKLNKEQLKEASKIVEKVRTRGQKNKK